MLIVNRHYPLVMIDWGDLEKILMALPKSKLVRLFKNDYEEDCLKSRSKQEIIELIYRECEGDIV